jgi:sentrin-specific protease 1
MTRHDQSRVHDLLNNKPADQVLVDSFNIQLTSSTLECLKPRHWLNDEVINFYMQLLQAHSLSNLISPAGHPTHLKCHFFNSFFFTKLAQNDEYCYDNVRRWSKRAKVCISKLDLVLVPVHVQEDHWCCACINVLEKRFEYYDIQGESNPQCLQFLRWYVADEVETYEPDIKVDMSEWTDSSHTAISDTRNM